MLNPLRRPCIVALCALTLGLASPAHAQAPKARLVLPAVSVLFAPVYIAADAGYFKDAGLDVELSMLPGPAAMNGLIGGSADLTTIAGVVQMRAALRGQKTLAIAGLQESATSEIVLGAAVADRLQAAKTPIDRVRALKGLTLAVDAANGLPHAYLRYLARQAGIDADRDIRLVFIAPTGMDAALERKEVDGFVFSSPFTLESVRRGARLWVSSPGGDFPELTPTTYNVLIARDGYCAASPAACKATVAALARSMALIKSDPQQAFTIISKRFARMDPDLLKAAFDSFQRNTPARPMPMGKAYEHTVNTMFGPQDDRSALKALIPSLYTDEHVNALR